MKGTTYAMLGATALATLILGMVIVAYPSNGARQTRFMKELHADFFASRQALETFARETGVQHSDGIDFASIRETPLGRRIRNVTRDANGNLYFILRDSTVTSNVGLVCRKGVAEFLGDQQEPKVDHTVKIDGAWYYYHAS